MTLPAVFSCAVLTLVFLAGACSDRGGRQQPDAQATHTEDGALAPTAQEGVAVSLELPRTVKAGAAVPMRLVLRNTTSAPLDLYLRGREATFDIAIADSTGDAVWRKLEGEVTQAILQVRTLAPGEVMELTHEWSQQSRRGEQVAPGRYTVRGSVLTDGQTTLDAAPVTLEITP